jgi:hypothetical protein
MLCAEKLVVDKDRGVDAKLLISAVRYCSCTSTVGSSYRIPTAITHRIMPVPFPTHSNSCRSHVTSSTSTRGDSVPSANGKVRIIPSRIGSIDQCSDYLYAWARSVSRPSSLGNINRILDEPQFPGSSTHSVFPTFAVATSNDGTQAFVLRFQPVQGIFGDILVSGHVFTKD